MVKYVKILVLFIIACLVVNFVYRIPQVEAKELLFTFVQVTDPHICKGHPDWIVRFLLAIKEINKIKPKPDFVFITGDLKDGSYKLFKQLVTKFNLPFYCIPGNHDVGNKADPEAEAYYRKEIGPNYYSFKHKGVLCIGLDTQIFNSGDNTRIQKQLNWLKEELEKSKELVLIFGHYPLYERSPDEPDGYYNIHQPVREELLFLTVSYTHLTLPTKA